MWTFVPGASGLWKGDDGSGCGMSSPANSGMCRSVRWTSFSTVWQARSVWGQYECE